jgi:lysophospholipase L1-like esterase
MILKIKQPVILSLLLYAGVVFGSLFSPLPEISKPAFAQEFSSYYYTLVRQHRRMDGNIPKDAVIFIGDSIIQGLAVSAVADRGVNYGISGDTTAGVLKRLSLYQSLARAGGIVLLVGVNDLGAGKAERLIENYRNILASMPRDRQVVVCAILPIDADVLQFPSGNSVIQAINAQLETLCDQFSQVSFINPGPYLADRRGNLKNTLHVGDGIHLSQAGYAILIDAFKAELEDSN